MGSRSVTTVVTADTMALNAAVFGFAGHSIVTPHQAIQNVWWTDERIEAKVTREFIVSKLRPNERDQLYRPVFGGGELSEDTYLDWILSRAKRIYLILVECGVSDQIFGVVDDSWDDEDLPIPKHEVPRLALSYKDDEGLNKRFYNNQFRFLLRPLDFHNHIDYAPNEVIPIEFVHRLPPAAALQKWSRIHLPKVPGVLYARRKVSLGDKDDLDQDLLRKFLGDADIMRSIEHEHIAPVCATWSQKATGYFMTNFIAEHTLKTFIDFRTPASMQKIKRQERSMILLEWLHCLATAVTYLHRRGLHHGRISPANVLVDENNKIAFADIGCLKSMQTDKRLDADELFNYGAPEFYIGDKKVSGELLRPPTPNRKLFGHRRGKSSASNTSDGVSDNGSVFSVDSMGAFFFKGRSNSKEAIQPLVAKSSLESISPRTGWNGVSISPKTNSDANYTASPPGRTAPPPPPPLGPPPEPVAQTPDTRSGDIFSLGCIFMDIINFIFKRKAADFVKHRTTKHKNASGKSSYVDSSFRNNILKVQSWMEILENDISGTQDPSLAAVVPHLFSLVTEMLNVEAHRRPSAVEVQGRIYDALIRHGGFDLTHCCSNVETIRSHSVLSTPSSFAGTTLSAGSSARPSIGSQPKLAAFPRAILSPPLDQARPKSPEGTLPPVASVTRSVTIRRLAAPVPPPPPPTSAAAAAAASAASPHPTMSAQLFPRKPVPIRRSADEGSNNFRTFLGVSVQ